MVVGLALALTAGLVFLGGRARVESVATMEAAPTNLAVVVSTNGKVEPVERVSIRAEFPTFVQKVHVIEGQQVKRGQPLFTLDARAIQAELTEARAELAAQLEALRAAQSGGRSDQVAQAAADLEKARAARELARRDFDSLSKLVAQKAATPDELGRARLALDQAESDLRSLEKRKQYIESQAQVDSGQATLLVERSRTRIADLESKIRLAHATAPVDGTLYSFPVHAGDFVNTGDLLAEMADLRHVRVRAFIDEPELGRVRQDQDVEIVWDARPDRVWKGRTATVPKQVVSRGTRNVGELLCSVDNEQLDLLPNTTVDVRIHISERDNVLAVPRGAIYSDGDRRYVYRVDDDRLHAVTIESGMANPTMTEIVSGLKQGDVVAIPGEVALRENMRIRVAR